MRNRDKVVKKPNVLVKSGRHSYATDFSSIRKWFKNKALKVIDDYVLPTLAEAESAGEWPKGASRKIRAALNKQAIAAEWANENKNVLDKLRLTRDGFNVALSEGWQIKHAMEFGQVHQAPKMCEYAEKLKTKYAAKTTKETAEAIVAARVWCRDFAPVAELMDRLDEARPAPTFVFGTLSPTVAKTLRECGLALRPETVRYPEVEWKRVKFVENGREFTMMVGTILWPEGTVHCASRFTYGTANNTQCEACGHAIKNSTNWIPLILDDDQGVPHSLWTGTDCARKLFGVEVKGEAKYEGRIIAEEKK